MNTKKNKKILNQDDWKDPFHLSYLLTEEEKSIKKTTQDFCKSKLLPSVVDANNKCFFDKKIYKEFGSLGFLGLIQAFIGWWMVKSGINNETNLLDVASYRLAIHLNLALLITSFIFLLLKINYFFTYIGSLSISFGQFSFERFKISLFILFLFFQITLGALVSGIDAGKSYNEWPLMDNNFVPEDYLSLEPEYLNFTENPATVQFNHRIMGYFLFFFGLYIWIKGRFKVNQYNSLKKDYNTLLLFLLWYSFFQA